MSDEYNKIFENLVRDDKDIVGLIAYGLYKNDKRNQIIEIKNQNRTPTKKDIERIERILSNRYSFYTEKANQLLDGTMEYLIETNKDIIYQNYFRIEEIRLLNDNIKLIRDEIKPITEISENVKPKSLLGELKIEILGNIAWTIILLILTVIIYFLNDDLQGYRNNIIKKISNPEQQKNDTSTKNTNSFPQ